MDLKGMIRDIPDFPEPGIVFKDITPVLADPAAFAQLVQEMGQPFQDARVSKVAGIEARGFTLAAPIALALGAGLIPLRKPNKLPYQTVREEYALEYGTDALEAHVDAVTPGERVLLVDDVIATGGTAAAAVRLLSSVGAEVVGFAVFIELGFLNGRAALDGTPLHVLVNFD